MITTDLAGDTPATMRLVWRIDEHAHAGLEAEIVGKRILVTDHDDWPLAHVIDAYRSQEYLEAGFRQDNDPHVVSFAPIRHVTDHKIRVHLFTCVLALAIAHLMRRERARADVALSVPAMLAELDGIGETVLLYQGERGRPRARHTITRMTPTQQHLYKIFDLDRCAPDADMGIRQTEDRKTLNLRKPQPNHKIFGNSDQVVATRWSHSAGRRHPFLDWPGGPFVGALEAPVLMVRIDPSVVEERRGSGALAYPARVGLPSNAYSMSCLRR